MTAATGRKTEVDKMNVLVFGAGAIGTYIGGSLAAGGQRVVFLEQPGAVQELRRNGLRLDLEKAGKAFIHIPSSGFSVAESLSEALLQGPFDIAIFALKSFDTTGALEGMRACAAEMPPILCLSNGVENEPALAALLGMDRIIAGTVTSSVTRRAVGDIVLERLRGVGLADGHPLSARLCAALNGASLQARLYPRPADMKWSKMLTNLMVNASVAILDMPPRAVLAHPGLFRLEIALLREALAVMRAQGIRVVDVPGTPVRLLAVAATLPAFLSRPLMVRAVGGGRGGKMPSFHIDLHAGRGRSEVEWINGAVARYGEKFSVPAPVNKQLTWILSALAHGDIALSEFSRQPEKLLIRVNEKKQGTAII
jgi:2-dehydropantoate 2-reductase